jgi:hypothetical protein
MTPRPVRPIPGPGPRWIPGEGAARKASRALLEDVRNFQREVSAVARALRRNDPSLSAEEAERAARELVKLDWPR